MNVWHAGAMRRVHGFGVSCVIRGVSGTLVGSSSEVSDGDATLGWPWDAADRVFGPYGVHRDVEPDGRLRITRALQGDAVLRGSHDHESRSQDH